MADHVKETADILYVLAVMIVAAIALLAALRMRKARNERRTEEVLTRHKDYFAYLAAHLDDNDDLGVPYGTLSSLEKKVIQEKLFQWIEDIRGTGRAKLADVCRQLGFAQKDIERLTHPYRGARIAAAYRLGVMRTEETVPELLKLLDKEKFGSSLFVIARSVAKSAAVIPHLKEMVNILAKHRKNNYELIVDILGESWMDLSPLYIDLLNEQDPYLQKIALTGMKGRTEPEVLDRLIRLSDSEDKDLRLKAVQACIRQDSSAAVPHIPIWLRHEDWEIRAEAVEAAGASGNPFFTELLKSCLEDPNGIVRFNAAQSLLQLEEAGFKALCEVAAAENPLPSSDMALEMIHEQMKRDQLMSDNLDNALQYNMQLHIYKQFFREETPLLTEVDRLSS